MKKNFKKVPTALLAKAKLLGDVELVVGCTKQFTRTEIVNGKLAPYGISAESAGGGFTVLPSKDAGKYSRRNACGHTITHRDQPKVLREIPYHVKDWYDEWHDGTYEKLCYPVEYVEPSNRKITARVKEVVGDLYIVSFRLTGTMKYSDPDFIREVLNGINIMWENVGVCGVERADAAMEEFEHVIHVPWKIFPLGHFTVEQVAEFFVQGRGSQEINGRRRLIEERLQFLKELGAKTLIQGLDSFNGYVGAELEDQVFVFDNVNYGNAAYILKGEWKELSKKPRSVLKKEFKETAVQVPHNGDWRSGIAKAIEKLRR